MLAKFLEWSVQSDDLATAILALESLGFRSLSVGDVVDYPYAVVSDGHFHIGLHQSLQATPALSFVLPDLADEINELRARGVELDFSDLSRDVFHQIGFHDPGINAVRMVEVRTFSPPHFSDDAVSHCGQFYEYALPTRNIEESIAYWLRLGFVTEIKIEQPYPYAKLARQDLSIGLHQSNTLRHSLPIFSGTDLASDRLRNSDWHIEDFENWSGLGYLLSHNCGLSLGWIEQGSPSDGVAY